MTIKPGDIVRYNIWHGVVNKVYRSAQNDDDSTLVEIFFVKNVFKMQRPEIVPLTDALQIAAPEALQAEVSKYRALQEHALDKLQASCRV
jgi:hypothetical protein